MKPFMMITEKILKTKKSLAVADVSYFIKVQIIITKIFLKKFRLCFTVLLLFQIPITRGFDGIRQG